MKNNNHKFRMTKGKSNFIIMNFIRLMLILAFFGAWRNSRWLVQFVAALALFVTFLPKILDLTFGIKIPAEFEVMVILFIYGTLFFGEVRGFYSMFWWWGILLNLASAIALGFVGFSVLYVLYKDEIIDASPLVIGIFSFCFAVAIGTLWEIFEFTLDISFGFHLQKGITDTMWGIITNSVGAFLVSLGGYLYIKNGRINIVSGIVEKFIKNNPKLFGIKNKDIISELNKLIKEGESETLEFKSTLRINLHTKEVDKKIEHSVLKTIVAYLNSKGGTLLIGVKDNGEILGVEKEGFINNDRLNLHFTNLIKRYIGQAYLPFIKSTIIKVQENKSVLRIDCLTSNKEVFLKMEKEEEFYVRNGPSSSKLTGSSLIEYVNHKFREN